MCNVLFDYVLILACPVLTLPFKITVQNRLKQKLKRVYEEHER